MVIHSSMEMQGQLGWIGGRVTQDGIPSDVGLCQTSNSPAPRSMLPSNTAQAAVGFYGFILTCILRSYTFTLCTAPTHIQRQLQYRKHVQHCALPASPALHVHAG